MSGEQKSLLEKRESIERLLDESLNEQDSHLTLDVEEYTNVGESIDKTIFPNLFTDDVSSWMVDISPYPTPEDKLSRPSRFVESPEKLPPPEQNVRYTIVLDFDETIVHVSRSSNAKIFDCGVEISPTDSDGLPYSSSAWSYYLRPGTKYFLEEISKLEGVEIIAWTAALYFHAERVAEIIDPDRKFIKCGICRGPSWFVKGVPKKGADMLPGRNPATTILIDDSPLVAKWTKTTLVVPGFRDISSHSEDRALLSVLSIIKRAHSLMSRFKDARIGEGVRDFIASLSSRALDADAGKILGVYGKKTLIYEKRFHRSDLIPPITEHFAWLIATHPLVIPASINNTGSSFDETFCFVLDQGLDQAVRRVVAYADQSLCRCA
jgi:hypothetical protein